MIRTSGAVGGAATVAPDRSAAGLR